MDNTNDTQGCKEPRQQPVSAGIERQCAKSPYGVGRTRDSSANRSRKANGGDGGPAILDNRSVRDVMVEDARESGYK